MGLIELVIVLAVVGFLLYLVTTYIPMEPMIKRIIVGVVIVVVAIWLIQLILGPLPDIRVGR